MLDRFRDLFQNEHQYVQENLSAYLDEELGARDKSRVQRHVHNCAACRAELASLRQTVELLQMVPEVPLPRSFLIPVSEGRAHAVSRPRTAFGASRTASALATFLFVLALTGNMLLPKSYGAPPGMGALPQTAFSTRAGEAADKKGPSLAAAPVAPEPTEVAAASGMTERSVVGKGGETADASPTQIGKEAPALTAPGIKSAESATAPAPTVLSKPAAVQPTRPAAPVAAAAAPTATAESAPAVAALEQKPARDVEAVANDSAAEDGQPAALRALQQASRRALVRDILNIAMWVLLVITVVLWTLTAVSRKQRR